MHSTAGTDGAYGATRTFNRPKLKRAQRSGTIERWKGKAKFLSPNTVQVPCLEGKHKKKEKKDPNPRKKERKNSNPREKKGEKRENSNNSGGI